MTADQLSSEAIAGLAAGTIPLNSLLGLDRDQIAVIAMLGYQAYEQGRREDARTIFEGLIALDCNLYLGYAGMAALALTEDRLEEAVRYLEQAAELNPRDPTVRANLGEALLRLGRLGEAAAQFEKALALDPQQSDAGVNRARAILRGMEVVLGAMEKASPDQKI